MNFVGSSSLDDAYSFTVGESENYKIVEPKFSTGSD